MSGAIPPLPEYVFMAWCLVKHRDNFTFTFTLTFYPLPNIFRVIKSRRMSCAGHVARMGEMRNSYDILLENLKGRDYLEELGIDKKIISEWILGKCCWNV
jgi:hypothetical protein